MTARRSLENPTIVLTLRDLGLGPATPHEVARELGLTWRSALEALRWLRGRGLVHICGWERNHGNFTSVWKLGKGKDAPKPKRMSLSERCKRWRASHREEYLVAKRIAERKRMGWPTERLNEPSHRKVIQA